ASSDARFDAGDVEVGPRFVVSHAADRTVGSHSVTLDGSPYAGTLTDSAAPFFLTRAVVSRVASESDTTNNDLNFLGVFLGPASPAAPAALVIRGRDDTDRLSDDPNDTISLVGGSDLTIAGSLTPVPIMVASAEVSEIR